MIATLTTSQNPKRNPNVMYVNIVFLGVSISFAD
jgi:hypothetical protein